MKLVFREAKKEDLPEIVAIYNQTIPGHQATADTKIVTVSEKEDWFAAYNKDRRPLWVMVASDQIVGWVGLEDFYGRPAYYKTAEISIYIDSKAQHQRLGQQALEFVATQLSRLTLDTLVAYIFSHNTSSQNLFRRNGFEVWGHLPEVAQFGQQRYSLDILGKHYSN